MNKTYGTGVRWRTLVLSVAVVFVATLGLNAQPKSAAKEKPATASAAGGTISALFVSDIHFDPFWDPSKVDRLRAAPVSEWKAILAAPDAADRAERFAQLEQACKVRVSPDTSYDLYASSLQAISADAGKAKFAVLSGDLMAHEFKCKFTTLVPQAKPGEYRAFTEKTIEFVMRELRAAVKGVPVYAALGNNDSDCGDYQLDANSAFLKATGEDMTSDLRRGDRAEALRTFGEGGFYSARLPAPLERTRILVLDDLFMSQRYETCGGKEDPSPAAAQIVWLQQQLDAARRNHERVWVMTHIPLGVNIYATATKGINVCSGGKPQMFLKTEALADAIEGYGDVIKLAIFAHTHMDEMRLLKPKAQGAPVEGVAIKMVGSISPIGGNNPSFTVAEIDTATSEMKDYRVFAASDKTGAKWSEEYDFGDTYKEPAFTAETVGDLIAGFRADPNAQTAASASYIQDFDSHGAGLTVLKPLWKTYTCELMGEDAEAFKACVCQGQGTGNRQ
ncbi:MAG TPA: metallophosphoesterase [Terracidiphilus sp.]|jgi:sphingomyelin phosphodiesterase acid-like 3